MDVGKLSIGQLFRRPEANSGNILKKFQKIIEEKYHMCFNNYWEFHKWTVNHLTEFWNEMWDFSGIIASKKFDKVIDLNVPMDNFPEWFSGAELNVAENMLKYRDERIAMILAGEDREIEKVTYAEMYEEVRLYAAAFRKFGLRKGDVVACYTSNRKEPELAMMAVNSIGGIWASALPLLGPQAVVDRFLQVSPTMLFTMDRFRHQGQEIDMLKKVQIIAEGLPSLEKIIIILSTRESKSKDMSRIQKSCFLDDFLKSGKEKDGSIPPLKFEQLPFSYPAFINYTSGTTGVPKALIHGCGVLLAVFRDISLHLDSSRDAIWLSHSSPGWGSWLVFSTLHFLGMTLVVVEGMPYFLSSTYMWDLVDEFKITHQYLPSSVLEELEKRGCVPSKENNLSSLQVFLAGGSVVKPLSYKFVEEKVKSGILFSTNYACTEFIGTCLTTERSLPLYVGEVNALGLGVDIKTVDDTGTPVVGELGELIICKPMPNLPLGLWGDVDRSLLKEKYFSKYPGNFALSDYAVMNPITRGINVCCRSDETLKQKGCRFGSSEIYNVLDKFPEIRDSLCISHYSQSMEERVVLFLKMNQGYTFNEQLISKVQKAITTELTERHVPVVILETGDIPYNMNGKKMEIIVKKILNNRPYNADSVRNPDCLMNFINVPELKGF